MQLQEIARVIRSKNAGPLRLTLDVMFDKEEDYRRVQASGALSASQVAALYGQQVEDVEIIEYPLALAIKIVLPRWITAGDPGDRDVYGAQQHAPLLGIEV